MIVIDIPVLVHTQMEKKDDSDPLSHRPKNKTLDVKKKR